MALVNALTTARESCRALALLRSDERWLTVSRIFDRTKDSAEQLVTKSSRQGSSPIVTPEGVPLILPPGRRQ
jgi:hypothetical protein